MATIKDVAKLAGVSISTASNAINGTRYVSQELAEKVFAAAEELNYQTDFVARSMKMENTMIIGVGVSSLSRIFVLPVINGIENIASKHGYSLNVFASNDHLSNEEQAIQMLVSSKVDGIIIGSVANYDNVNYFKYLSSLRRGKKKIPVISIERNLTEFGIYSVHVDNKKGGYIATSHLIEKGCSKIVHITGPSYSDIVNDRVYGYKKAISEAGITFDNDLIVKGDFSPLSGYRATKRLLLNGIRFDAIFAGNDQMAIGALKALKEHDINVPKDVMIIGFDNTFVSSIVEPSLTTVNVPQFRIGTSAVRFLLDILTKDENAAEVSSIEIPINIIERESTGKSQGTGWEMEYW